MSVLTGPGRRHLEGHKSLTKDLPVVTMDVPDLIYVPLVDGMAIDFTVHVEVGDEVKIGTKLATRKSMYLPLYAPVSGVVKKIERRMHATKRMQQHIVIENNHQDETTKVLDIADPDHMSQEDVYEAIKELGLTGMGGSGFPTHIKYLNAKDIDLIIINGVECEPYITADHVTMKRDYHALFDGTQFMMKAANAKEGIIAIKEHKPDLLALLNQEAASYPQIKVVEVPDVYPMGWERLLIKTVTGKTYDRLPAEAGVIVDNSTTAIALSQGIRTGLPLVNKIVTVSGDGVKTPANVEVRVGTPAQAIIKAAGGYIDEGNGHIIAGGPMMGKSIVNDLFVISYYNNALTVLKEEPLKAVACLKCGECVLHCPMNLQPVRIMQAEKAADDGLLEKLDVLRCVECGMCSYICPSKIEVTDFIQKGKRRYNMVLKRRRMMKK
ncbi:MAG: RnfABCDGE type electron transport complex subunit C [bacterium]